MSCGRKFYTRFYSLYPSQERLWLRIQTEGSTTTHRLEITYYLESVDKEKSCAFYEWLGFERFGKVPCRNGYNAMLTYGNVTLVLGYESQFSKLRSLPFRIHNREMHLRRHELERFGGKVYPVNLKASTMCSRIADPDGHSFQICP